MLSIGYGCYKNIFNALSVREYLLILNRFLDGFSCY